MAARSANDDLKALLKKRGVALGEERASELERLLIAGADPNLRIADCPAIIRCIDLGYVPRAVEVLLANGADPNARCGKRGYYELGGGETALARAACSIFHAHSDVWVRLLLEYGADAQLRDSKGNTVVDHLMACLKENMALSWWSTTSMSEFAIRGTIRVFHGQVGPLLAILTVVIEHGARPSSMSIEEMNSRLDEVTLRWNDGVKWLTDDQGRTEKARIVPFPVPRNV